MRPEFSRVRRGRQHVPLFLILLGFLGVLYLSRLAYYGGPSSLHLGSLGKRSRSEPYVQKSCNAQHVANAPLYFERTQHKGCHYKGDFALDVFHAVVPEATVFVDIGVNKGFHSATLLALYRPNWGINSTSWFMLKRSMGCGACRDCKHVEVPIIPLERRVCGGPDVPEDDICFPPDRPLPELRFLAFDGSKRSRDIIYQVLDRNAKAGFTQPRNYPAAWAIDPSILKEKIISVQHFAFMERYNATKTVTFLENGELSQIIDDSAPQGEKRLNVKNPVFSVVSVMTIDEMRKREGVSQIDIIKTDTEGFDALVARGAVQTIKDKAVTMYMMEIGISWKNERVALIVDMFEQNGYSCYGDMVPALVKFSHGCWSDAYERYGWGNMFCVLATTAKGLKMIEYFDAHSVQFNNR